MYRCIMIFRKQYIDTCKSCIVPSLLRTYIDTRVRTYVCTYVLYTIGPPVFRTPLEPISVPVGGVATFNCDVYSNPMLQSVRWVFSGVTIVSDGLRIVATNTQLIINSVQSEDEGSYSCVCH